MRRRGQAALTPTPPLPLVSGYHCVTDERVEAQGGIEPVEAGEDRTGAQVCFSGHHRHTLQLHGLNIRVVI